ncbi:uncharacterized protein LOC120079297 [Benincasa hispida]|uniref:uncharacterized protein LOC120079297 n=1 Tax=Benincasa hispida TaxID=102211 RepID=UPI0018FF77F6|nr:uncharacterized protein LOC120079297 [Benincasa hispida]
MINGFNDRCERVGLTHLVFVDDLMIFYATERDSLEFIRQVLTDFVGLSRLVANIGKSSMFVAGVESGEAKELAAFMGFSLGSLHVRYLGLPLLVGQLRAMDCAPLIQRITARIRSWAARSLSFAGSAVSRGGAQVAWDEVCLPLGEGRLGVKHVASWNQAAIMKLLWLLLIKSGSLWVAWVETYVLCGLSLWAIRSEVGRSWCLRAILHCRYRFKHLGIECPPVPGSKENRIVRDAYDKWIRANEKVYAYILASISDVLAKKHESISTAMQIMESLRGMFGQLSFSLRLDAIKYVYNCRMKEWASVREHILDMMFCTNALMNQIEYNLTTLFNGLQAYQTMMRAKGLEPEVNVTTAEKRRSSSKKPDIASSS